MQKLKMSLTSMKGQLTRDEMKKIVAGSCNPTQWYDHPCQSNNDCGYPDCSQTLYCYIPPDSGSGTCLFR